jgi:DNA polymerase-1
MDHERINIYHPIKKIFVEKPDHVYLDWKALRGDVSDNIPGIKGVGDKTATKIINDPELMKETLTDPMKRLIFERNKSLIVFHWFKDLSNDLQNAGVEIFYPSPSMENVIETFDQMGFKTMLTEKYWPKFENAFSTLQRGMQ